MCGPCDSHAVEVPVLVRPATPEDLEDVARTTVDAYVAANQLEDGPDGAYGRVLGDAAARLRDAVFLVAVRQGSIVGTVTICPEGSPFREIGQGGEVEFRFLAVAPSVWGHGIGRLLVNYCQSYASAAGSERLVIGVRDTNVEAIAMYERCGFAHTPTRDWEPVAGVQLLCFEYNVNRNGVDDSRCTE